MLVAHLKVEIPKKAREVILTEFLRCPLSSTRCESPEAVVSKAVAPSLRTRFSEVTRKSHLGDKTPTNQPYTVLGRLSTHQRQHPP